MLPDGRQVHAVYEDDAIGWVVWLVGQEERPVASRDIHAALEDLLEPSGDLWPKWFIEAAGHLAAWETDKGRRYLCPCCGQVTLAEPPPGTYEICDECGWEDDPVQFCDIDYRGGANPESLREARENYLKHGSHAAPPWPTPKTRSVLPPADDD